MYKTIFPSTKSKVLQGPFKNYTDIAEIYKPVDCDFTDELEYVSVKKIRVEIKYWSSNGKLIDCTGHIIDIFTKDKEEFLMMSDFTQIRLDRLFQIGIIDD